MMRIVQRLFFLALQLSIVAPDRQRQQTVHASQLRQGTTQTLAICERREKHRSSRAWAIMTTQSATHRRRDGAIVLNSWRACIDSRLKSS
eukprot:6460496-Amphidinium_carterae.2